MDPLNKEQRKRNMQANKSTGNSTEILLAKALWSKGYRYRKNDKSVYGKPDISFKKFKIAIFIDGEFWHGKDWENKKVKIQNNNSYWINKIERNIERDKKVNAELKENGWTVLRYWHNDIKRNLEVVMHEIEQLILLKRVQ